MKANRDITIAVVIGILLLTGSPWWWSQLFDRKHDVVQLNGRYVLAGTDNTAIEAHSTANRVAGLGGPKPIVLLKGNLYKVLVGPFEGAESAEHARQSIDALIHTSPETIAAVEDYCPNFTDGRIDSIVLLKCGA